MVTQSARINLFHPQQTDPALLESIFIGQAPLLEGILTKLKQWHPPAPGPHILLAGPHGIGKTCLLHLLSHRMRQGPLSQSWVPVALPEEGYALRSPADLLVQTLSILARETRDGEILRVHQEAATATDAQRAAKLALSTLRRFRTRTGRRVVLMLENAERVLNGRRAANESAPLLRKLLSGEEWLALLATTSMCGASVAARQMSPIDFDEAWDIPDLTFEEQMDFLGRLAAQEGVPDFEVRLHRLRPRLQALYHFTGGTPRLTLMLFSLINCRQLTDVKAQLAALLDTLTPFYRDRMDSLARQEAQLVEQMALLPEGCTPTELAHHARMPAKIVRSLLIRLEKAGCVCHEPRRHRKTVYLIRERPFRLWHQLAHGLHLEGGPRDLLDFFTSWYDSLEQAQPLEEDLAESNERRTPERNQGLREDHADFLPLVTTTRTGKPRLEGEFDALRHMVLRKGLGALKPRFEELDKKRSKDADYFVEKGRFLIQTTQDLRGALAAFHRACSLAPRDPVALFNRAVLLDRQGNASKAEKDYKQAAVYLAAETSGQSAGNAGALLIEALRESPSKLHTEMAAALLGRLRARRRIPELISIATTAQELWRRRHCTLALGLIGGSRATRCLLDLLHEEAPEVQSGAAEALGHLRVDEATLPLAACLANGDQTVRASAAAALGRIQTQEAVGALMSCLHDEAAEVRSVAAAALGQMRTREATAPLIARLHDDVDEVRGSAAFALGLLRAEAALPPLLSSLRHTADTVRRSAAFALGLIGSAEAVSPLIACLTDNVAKVRSSAATALGQIRSEEAVESLVACLGDDTSQVRRSAAMALGLIRSKRAVPPLVVNLSDPVADVRSAAVSALGRIGGEEAAMPLIALLRKDEPAIRAKTAASLAHIGSAQAIGPLLESACTEQGPVGQQALLALTALIGNHPVPELAEVLEIMLTKPKASPEQRCGISHQGLRAAFASSNPGLIRRCVDVIERCLEHDRAVYKPYRVACEYIESSRSLAVLERQHPEMREAAGLLIARFDGTG